MRIGFTGTREGMTTRQIAVASLMLAYADELHHGDCDGADAQAHDLGRLHGAHIVGHPPKNGSKRAFCECDELREPKGYLERDDDIVDETDELIATPKEFEPQDRGGTWYTINYAKRVGKPVTIIYPDGSVG